MVRGSSPSEPAQSVDFEITLAAILSTSLISLGSNQATFLVYVSAFGLLLVTLVRRMAVIGEYADFDRITLATNPLMEAFSVFAIIHLLAVVSRRMDLFSIGNADLFEFILVSIFIGIAAIVIQEFAFHDYFNWWAIKFASISQEEGDLWAVASDYSNILSTAPPPPAAERHKLRRVLGVDYMLDRNPSIEPSIIWVKQLIFASKHVILPSMVLLIMIRISSVEIDGTGTILVALTLFFGLGLLEDHIKYLYLTYGNSSELKTDAHGLIERGINEIRRPGLTQSIYVILVFYTLF